MTEQNNPFGQPPQQPPSAPLPPQQAFGDAPPPPAAPGEGTFGAAPGFPPPTAGEAFGTAPAPEQKKKGGVAKIIGIVVTVVVVLCLSAGFVLLKSTIFSSDATKKAQTGDCIGNLPQVGEGEDKQAPDAKVVECTSTDAAYKVEGRLENKTEAEATSDEICSAYADALYVYRAIDQSSGKGYVLCLSEVKK